MSSPLRIELRPAPEIRACLAGLALLAACALLLSALPAWTAGVVPLLLGLAWHRPGRAAARALVLRDDGTSVLIDDAANELEAAPRRLQRRGWLSVLTLEAGGRTQVHLLTPSTIDAPTSRRLGLWFDRHAARAMRAAANDGVTGV